VTAVVAVVAGGLWLLNQATAHPAATGDSMQATVQPGPAVPDSAAPADTGASARAQPVQPGTTETLSAWANRIAAVTGIPARALVAYGNAEVQLRAGQPACHVSWATLAGIGRIESDHGQYGNAVLQANGYPSKPIIGVPLDGSPGVRAVTDTDGGRYDGDPTYDHAVGPMQFLPGTWARWGGGYHPEQIDAAALAAARYLCAGGRDMATAAGWWSGILSYNDSADYAQQVFDFANGYARAAQRTAGS
jgi:membrane-bound lytic murein transglycosylase B